ncbi:hypothetical protein H9660_14225 [Clostridium sp. Sa3CUN1]|uniref:Uncharacterized protein n=1 Tax=Clostridium gallinarum TaxID=2762246 RepID=A0ABR8Q7B3_9CLOT|nr:hypothetical protein [Clostridium gallinarum]MBD7916300.1 hypothetical protein [Clostridium gallinarum]
MDIKVRGLRKEIVACIDEKAKSKGKSRNEYLVEYLENNFYYADKLKEIEDRYKFMYEKMLKIIEINTLTLNKFCEENLLDINEEE